jgi:hypothetical protein
MTKNYSFVNNTSKNIAKLNFYFVYLLLFLVLFYSYFSASAQQKILRYNFAEFLVTNNQNINLPLAFAGGLNSPQFSTIDLNGDGQNDLFVFDRTTNRIFTFLNENNRYRYAPEYEILFPSLQNWCLLVDYDKDGKKDIFTATNSSIAVYKNTTLNNHAVTFSTKPNILTTKNISGTAFINIGIDATDIPAITDVDNDGDIDIIFFTPAIGVSIEWTKNISIEKYQKPDSLEFEKVTTRWGDFEECSQCNEYKFGTENCFSAIKQDDVKDDKKDNEKSKNNPQTLRVEHSGSSQLLIDLNSDGLKDMLMGDVSCNNLSAFINKGTRNEAKFNDFIGNFPQTNPVDFHVFPAAYYEDIDFDGIKDLIVSPNVFDNTDRLTDFKNSVWLYKNTNTTNSPNFNFVTTNFLQNQMIDVGEYAKPVVIDLDNDGDLDMLIANGGSLQADKSYKTQLYYYQNIGTNTQPNFVLKDENLWNFLSINGLYLRPTFADLNNDGATDLIFTIANQQNSTSLFYVLNEKGGNQALDFDLTKRQVLQINTAFRPFDEPLLTDLNGDGQVDLLLGRLQGNLEYWQNKGNLTFELQNNNVGKLLNTDTGQTANLLSFAVTDLTNDGQPDLIIGNSKGELNVYDNFMTAIRVENTILTPLPSIIRHKISNLSLKHTFGGAVCPAIFGKDIFVGTQTGGVHYLRFSELITGLDNSQDGVNFTINVFPNPATNSLQIQSNENLVLSLYNILGQKTAFTATLKAHETLTWQISNLSIGIYILVCEDKKGYKKIIKVIKE